MLNKTFSKQFLFNKKNSNCNFLLKKIYLYFNYCFLLTHMSEMVLFWGELKNYAFDKFA